jgi:nitroreductase
VATGPSALDVILARSSKAALRPPAPDDAQLELVLRAATTVPDHGGLRPWRFVVVRDDESRAAFGEALVASAREANPDLLPAQEDKARAKAFAAPTSVAIVAAVDPTSKVPVWEQVASAACTGYAMALAAHALGLGAIWKSAAHLGGAALRDLLGMGPDDQLLGWVNLGHVDEEPGRARVAVPPLGELATVLAGHERTAFSPPGSLG